ncbi:MAG TPA: helix-turn-helix domain-containing protein [Propionibacteriaceae bacterium]|nr:helix-turn-helix domain-containing protein [Propionibacteriaceae bacterium]
MLDVEVIETPEAAAAALDPMRSRILAALAEPGSATTVARVLGLPRQKVNYHLRALEAQGLVEMVSVRARRGLTERMLQATAASYVVSPAALGEAASTPDRTERLSSRYLIALAARMVREVATLARRAEAAGRPLATLTIDTELRFASAADRAAFTRDLAEAVAALAARYHDESADGGRWHRLVVAAHPSVERTGDSALTDPPNGAPGADASTNPAASSAIDPTEEPDR